MTSSDDITGNEPSRLSSFTPKKSLQSYLPLVIILCFAALVWIIVFNRAMSDFLLARNWNGSGQINLFGFTIPLEFEGWSDYSYYYLTWGDRFLDGYTPYTDAFNNISPDEYVPYFFPPPYLYLCAIGNSLPMYPFGIGLLICVFGFATAFPVYGIAEYLSKNRRVGEIAVASYLLNPLILYHTAYEWLNPAPFVFFMMLSFYLLMKQHRITGTLAMVTAVFFKQTAVFMALPLIAYLLRTPPPKELLDYVSEPEEEDEYIVGDNLDLRGFLQMVLLILVFGIILSLPYIFDFGNYLYYLLLKPGMTLLDSVTTLPASNIPITLAVPLIVIGAPEPLVQFVNLTTAYSVLLLISMVALSVPILFEAKDDRYLRSYWRRILFLSLLLLLAIHIFSPRGIYKYYLVALIPFFSIVNSEQMISRNIKRIQASLPMIINPLLITVVILLPNRYIYLSFLILVFLSYMLHEHFAVVYSEISRPFCHTLRGIKRRLFFTKSETAIS